MPLSGPSHFYTVFPLGARPKSQKNPLRGQKGKFSGRMGEEARARGAGGEVGSELGKVAKYILHFVLHYNSKKLS